MGCTLLPALLLCSVPSRRQAPYDSINSDTPRDSVVDTSLVSHQSTHSCLHFHLTDEGTKLQTDLVDFAFRVYSATGLVAQLPPKNERWEVLFTTAGTSQSLLDLSQGGYG